MKKLLCVLLLAACLGSLLTGCYTCDLCRENKLIFDKTEETVFGQEYSYCGDCKDKLENMADELIGR